MIDLGGARVLVTGGSRGIGAACCRAFAAAGAAVWVHCRRERGRAERLLAELPSPAAGEHGSSAADLSTREGVEELFAALEAAWDGLDCLVNNAGVWEQNRLERFDAGGAEATWRLNLRGPFLCTARALPALRRSARASIVNLSSTAGQRGEAGHSPYAASKGALIAATKSWATELAPGIRVNAVAPGWVDTEMCAEAFAGGGRERYSAEIPLGRVAAAEDIAGPVVFLASPLARHVTGEVLNVNGGSVLAG